MGHLKSSFRIYSNMHNTHNCKSRQGLFGVESIMITRIPGQLRTARKRSGMTQSEAARRADLSQPQLSRYETGASTVSAYTLMRLMHIYAAVNKPGSGDDRPSAVDLAGRIEAETDGDQNAGLRSAIAGLLDAWGARGRCGDA